MTVWIRCAVVEDVALILDMIRDLADYEKLGHQVEATEERLARSLFGSRPAAEVLLAFTETQCAGFMLFFSNYSTFLAKPGIYLEDLYVKPEFRGNGIGLELLRHLAKRAIERDCGRIEWSVLDWNSPSIAFYRKLGAVALDDWTTYRLTGDALQQLGR